MNVRIPAFPSAPTSVQATAVENWPHGDRFIHKVINSVGAQGDFPFAAKEMEREPTLRFNFFD
jgi:hypothetical protein